MVDTGTRGWIIKYLLNTRVSTSHVLSPLYYSQQPYDRYIIIVFIVQIKKLAKAFYASNWKSWDSNLGWFDFKARASPHCAIW